MTNSAQWGQVGEKLYIGVEMLQFSKSNKYVRTLGFKCYVIRDYPANRYYATKLGEEINSQGPFTFVDWFVSMFYDCLFIVRDWSQNSPCIFRRVSGHPPSAQESAEMRSLHQRGRETKKFLFLS